MNKLAMIALTIATILFMCSHDDRWAAAQQDCGDGHSMDDLERTDIICSAGIGSCCPRLESLNFNCLCSNTANISNIISWARGKCKIRVPQIGQCQQDCKEGTSEEDFDRIQQLCEVGFTGSCCSRLKSLNFDCMCSPNSGVTVPTKIVNLARRTCKIDVIPVPKCPADGNAGVYAA